MNRPNRPAPVSGTIRAGLLLAALLATALVGASIDGLAGHYQSKAQMAGAPVVVAQR